MTGHCRSEGDRNTEIEHHSRIGIDRMAMAQRPEFLAGGILLN